MKWPSRVKEGVRPLKIEIITTPPDLDNLDVIRSADYAERQGADGER